MAEDKPCISELFENDVLDMELVGKIAHNELDKQKGFPFSSVSANPIRAFASEYIDSYANDPGIIEAYAAELDSQLSVEDYRGGKISPEFMLGCAIGFGAASHANADIDYFSDKFSSRAVIEIEELGLPTLRSECRSADDFSLAGVNPDTKFPIGFVSVQDVANTVSEHGSEHMKETLKPADFERVASSLADAEQCIERYELADGITFNAELEVEKIDLKQGEQGLDDICEAKSEEADLVADGSAVEYGAVSNEQSK